MKNYLVALCFLFISIDSISQNDSLYVNGRFLTNQCGNTLILQGIDYPVLDDWDFPANMNNGSERLSEIQKTNANAVRFEWYNNYGQPSRPAYYFSNLDSLLTRSARYNMVPIVGLWDLTCKNDWTNFSTNILGWWTKDSVVKLFLKHKKYAIVDLANEFGYYQWTSNPATALTTFQSNYIAAIQTLRTAGYVVPIMIDAPDCGQDPNALISIGQALINADPLHNILLDIHTYWYTVTNNSSSTTYTIMNQLKNSGLPFLFGEVANYQDNNYPCQYSLNYTDILTNAHQMQFGWLWWSWYKDNCASRSIAPNGTFGALSTIGQDIVNNTTYGLSTTTVKNATTFTNCTFPLAIENINLIVKCNIATNLNFSIDYNLTFPKKIDLLQSTDGTNWQTIFEKYISNHSGKINFDLVKPTTKMFYKAMETDESGHILYSNISVCEAKPDYISIFPNPANENITINSKTNLSEIIISDIYGKEILRKDNLVATSNLNINTSKFSDGMYSIKIYENNSIIPITKKVIIAH